jgi:hypothetical protein
MKSARIAAAVLTCALCAARAFAQDATGRVIGVVTDPSSAVISNAKVLVTNVETGVTRETTTGSDGAFQVLQIPIGMYKASAEAPGFRKTVTAEAPLRINESLRFDMRLEVGAITETVQVDSGAVGVETVNSTLGQSVTRRPIQELPLNGRNVLDLALLQPGVTPSRSGSVSTNGTFSVAGGRTDSVTFLLDGGINNNLRNNLVVFNPNPDTIQEFRILNSNYSAEYGRNAGGIISTVVRSGTNDVHGSAFEYLRNEAFNATPFFNNANQLPKPILKRNQFGASAGGPLSIPKVFSGRDRMFWFVGWQSQRQSALVQSPSVVTYTPRELQGDFSLSNSSRTGPDPRVAGYLQKFPYFQPNPTLAAQGIIDPVRINSVTQNYIKAGLIPASPTGVLFPQGAQTRDNDEILGKADFLITQNDRLSVLLGASRAPQVDPFSQEADVTGFPTASNVHQYFANIGYTKIFTPAVLNELRLTAQRNHADAAVPALRLPLPNELGIVGITPDDPTGPTQLQWISGLRIGFSRQGPTTLIDNTYAFTDNFSWVRNKHTMKFGFYYSPYQNNTVYDFYINGRFRFFGPSGRGSGNDLADALFGLPDQYTQFPQAPSNIRTHSYSAFAQDEWRVTPRLMLTLGIRYEYNSPKRDLQGRSFSLAFNQQSQRFINAPRGLLFPGDPGAPTGANFPDKNNWAPRLGFAFSATKKTSLRGGFGVFYDILKGEDNLQFNGQAPFFGFNSFRFPALNSINSEVQFLIDPYQSTGVVNTFPSKPPPRDLDFAQSGFLPFGGSSVFFVDPHLRTPYTFQYNLNLQHEIATGFVGELAYVGSQFRKGTALIDRNPFLIGTNAMYMDTQAGAPPGQFSFLDTFANVGTGHYDSMQASLTKRFTQSRMGSTFFTLAYTWAHGFDTASGFRENSVFVPAYNPKQFYASSDEDIRHRVVFSGGWDLPFGRAGSSLARRLAGGWSLYPIVTFRSGFPLDIVSGLLPDGVTPGPSGAGDPDQVRPNLVGNSIATFDPHRVQVFGGVPGNYYFNPANFVLPVGGPGQYTYGTLGRNAFRGPGRTNVDFAIAKRTPLFRERVISEFRAEAFNIFNHTQFDNPSTNMQTGTLGQISTTADPRILQLALRITF